MSMTTPLSDRNGSNGDVSPQRTLNEIAAVASSGVSLARIRQVLMDVAEQLKPLHAQGRVHGGIAMSTIGLDASGKALLQTPPLTPCADAEDAARIDGYAAFEQYTDDPDSPCGPWTDIYALSAVAYTLLTGHVPPSALARCVKDDLQPLVGSAFAEYDPAFSHGVDSGLSMQAGARPATVDAFEALCGLTREVPVEAPSLEAVPVAPSSPAPEEAFPVLGASPAESAGSGARVPWPVVLGVLAAIALAIYLWLRPGGDVPADERQAAGPPHGETSASIDDPAESGIRSGTTPAEVDPAATTTEQASRALSAQVGPDAVASQAQGVRLEETGGESSETSSASADASAPEGAPTATDTASSAGDEDAAMTGAVAPPVEEQTSMSGATASPASPADVSDTSPGDAQSAEGAAQPSPGDAPRETVPDARPADEETPPAAALVPVRIAVRPWGEVIIDGRSHGVSPPLKSVKLAPGRHRVTVRNSGASDYQTTITVKRGSSASIAHVFE